MTSKEGGEMATEGKGAQQEYVPVWLTVEDWRLITGLIVSSYGGPEAIKILNTVSDAIEWAEGR